MAFWSRLFGKRKKAEKQPEDWENLVYDRDDVDFRDEEQRSRYITNCLEQMAEASKEINLLTGEYALVTSYLTDMEEIEALPEQEREGLNKIARQLLAHEQECERYRGKENRMDDNEYYQMRKQEDEVQEGIGKLKECENYGELVRQDLKRLDRERNAYEFRRSELEAMMNNFRGMSVIFMTAFVICMVLLVLLQFAFEMDTRMGYLLAVGAVVVAVAVLVVRYTDSEKELSRVERAVNKLIQLQNKVKIRYVNNKNLQEYLRMKYDTDSAAALEKLWTQYLQEKEERKEFAEAEAKTEYYQKLIVDRLKNYRVGAPDRWVGHPEALLDPREMVEMRHELIVRRQALRKQMEYNNGVAETARKEIMDIVNKYPAYAGEILAMVDKYDNY
ncbi:MAG: hypothetical protein NC123_04540 [Butyrivibrio sp.]|nr:hypothetical protein [Acetatifactor muris]MCM1558796.1 hypothetical protein [Butyrivibrio sp.]